MRIFQHTFEIRERSFISALSVSMTVPVVTLLICLILIFLSFEIKSFCWRVLSELTFITSGIKLRNSLFFSGYFFTIRLFTFIFLSIQPVFVHKINTEIHILMEKIIQVF